MSTASGERHTIGAGSASELEITRVTVALQDAAKVAEMARCAVVREAVREVVSDHRRLGSSQG